MAPENSWDSHHAARMLAHAIIAAKSTSIWPDLSNEDWAMGNDAWKNVQILLGIIWINLLCQPNAGCQVIFLVEGPLVRIRMAITQGASWLFFLFLCVCVFLGGWRSRVTRWHGVTLGLAFRDVKPATGKKHQNIGAGTGQVEDLNYSPSLKLKWWWEQIYFFGGVGMVTFQRAIGNIGGKCFLISSWMACGSPAANVHDLFAARSTLEVDIK